MFQHLQKKKRKIEHCDQIPAEKKDSSKSVGNAENMKMNSAGNLKQKIEVKHVYNIMQYP